MTQSPSPIVDEVAELAAKYRNFEFGHKVMDADDFIDLEADIRRLAASLVSPPKAAGEIREWEVLCGDGTWMLVTDRDGRQYHIDEHKRAGLPPPVFRPLYANHEARGDGVRVKPLEWHGEPDWCFADTTVGHYTVSKHTNPDHYRTDSYGRDRMQNWRSDTSVEAKAVAQLDYETRIRSALLPPLGDGRAEIVEALKPFAEAIERYEAHWRLSLVTATKHGDSE